MDMDEFLEKKKELKEAEEKLKNAKEALNGERKRKLRERFKKINIFAKLKPWIVWNSILTILVLVLFIGAYSSNPNPDVSEENKFGSFLDNIFGFLNKEETVVEEDPGILGNTVIENNTTNVSSEPEPENTLDITVTVPEDEEEIELINFDLYAQYNGQGFQVLNTTTEDLIYYLVIDNKEGFKIRCEGLTIKNDEEEPNAVTVDPYDQRSLITRVSSDLGDLVTIKHEITCYEEGKSIDEGTVKKIVAKVYFS